jgi:glucosamine-6-phosphate deaminase
MIPSRHKGRAAAAGGERDRPVQISIHADRAALGQKVAADAAEAIRQGLRDRERLTLVVATGSSQFEVLSELVAQPSIPWERVAVFHLDEYVGLSPQHRASFRRYLRERFVERLPARPAAFHELDGQAEPHAECRRLAALVPTGPFDVALVGIGENGHLAFNDPPADFETTDPYIVVTLDEPCRRQQVGEGWFATLADVPTQAISMSVHRILSSRTIFCSVPDRRKAAAVRAACEGPVTPEVPASVLQRHSDYRLHVDREAASLLKSCEPARDSRA